VAQHGVPRPRIGVLPLFSTLKGDGATSDGGEPDTVLFAGRMTALKGGDVLVRAAARARTLLGRPVRLLLAGEGPQKDEWRRLALSLGVQAELTGWVKLADRARVFSRGQLVAVPSLWPEPFGLIGLDMAALGRPAVAFDVGGIGEWLADTVNGRLVNPASGEAGLARAIAELLNAPAERTRMGMQALEVARRMTVGAHVDRLESVLRDAAAG
jgi:glycosyltransferase involved in cell wall biosynthesis